MYEETFQLKHRPFPAAPLVQHYFASRASEAARTALVRCIERAEGTGLLVGPPGSGKTLLLELLAEQFNRRFAVALLTCGRFSSRRDLLQAILFELGQPYRDMHEGDLRLALIDFLEDAPASHGGLLLLVDEAHTLPMRLLDEVRMLTNLLHNGQPRVRLLLAGGSVLEERLTHPKLESCSQRITARCYLQALDREETRGFVMHQVTMAGGREHLFAASALDAIHDASGGVPRIINQVCDHALAIAYADGLAQIDAPLIERAWADLQQLPTPWNETSRSQPAATAHSVIEIGGDLDAADDLPAASIEIGGELPEHDDQGHRTSREAPADEEFPLEPLTISERPVDEVHRRKTTQHAHPPHGKPRSASQPLSPDEQLEAIESHLAAFDEPDHVAPGRKMPIAGFDPFSEPFAEEEVLVDRFAQFELQFRRAVASSEGRMLSAMLEPFQHAAPAPRLTIAEEAHDEGLPIDLEGDMPLGGQYELTEQREEHRQRSAADHRAMRESGDDACMIIVEEDPIPSGEAPTAPVARQLKYGQLFAQLQRQQ